MSNPRKLFTIQMLLGVLLGTAVLTSSGFFNWPFEQQYPVQPSDYFRALIESKRPTTIDKGMQQIAKTELGVGLAKTQSRSGTAIILEASTGAIKALVNQGQPNLATSLREPGSVMKPLLLAAVLNEGVKLPSTYFEPGYVETKGHVIINALHYPPQQMTTEDVLIKSLNTGAVFLLKSMGDHKIDDRARNTWYSYLTEHYHFGQAQGFVRPPSGGQDLEFRYATMAFGVGITITPLQLASAYAAITNGGIYYYPYIVPSDQQGGSRAISSQTSVQLRQLLAKVLASNNKPGLRKDYLVGGKSGTASVAQASGTYKVGVDNGTYVGFVGHDSAQYIILVCLDEPVTEGFASSEAAKVWANISNALIDNHFVN